MSSSNEKEHHEGNYLECGKPPSPKVIDDYLIWRVQAAVMLMARNIVTGAPYCIPIMFYLHLVGNEMLGICNVRLALLRSAILFSREVFQTERSYYQTFQGENAWCKTVNLIWLMVPTAAISSCACCFFWLGNWIELPSEEYILDYQFAVKMFGVSCVIESLTDPAAYTLPFTLIPWDMLKTLDNFRFIKPSIVAATAWYFPEHTIRATACAELTVAIVRFGVLWMHFFNLLRKKSELNNKGDLHPDNPLVEIVFPSIISYSPRNGFSCQLLKDGTLVQRYLRILKKAVMEQIHRNGERFVITLVPGLSFSEQGIYDSISDFGHQIVIYIFHPLRTQSFTFYSRKLPSSKFENEKTVCNLKKISDGVFKFLRITALIGYSMLVFGLSYSSLFLHSYSGSLLVDWPGPLLMKIQCLVIFLKGLHGTTETYAFYSISESGRKRYRMILTKLGIARLLGLGLSIQFIGSIGCAVTNCILLGYFVFHNIKWFIRRDFEDIDDIPEKPIRGLFPNKTEAAGLVTVLITTCLSEWFIYPYSTALHLAIGIISLTWLLGAIMFTEPGSMSTYYIPLWVKYL